MLIEIIQSKYYMYITTTIQQVGVGFFPRENLNIMRESMIMYIN
jgi:hypothetical protein